VFAFYASPITLGEARVGAKCPGVVLIHGGGGTAYAEWVQAWAKRGYAAIAMDLSGSRPPDPEFDAKGIAKGNAHSASTRTRLPNGGPNHGLAEKFDSIGGDVSDDWPFHAAASVIRAHTLLRSFPEVDAEHTAVTGISWGGYTTCLVAALDDRFKAAVPVYGCGFLHEGESVQKPHLDKLGDRRAEWVKEYDPGSVLPRCRVPIFFVNGTNDIHYVLDSYMKTYAVVPGEKHLRIEVNMRHSHVHGWAPKEIALFIDSKCRSAPALPVLGKPVRRGERIELTCECTFALKSAQLNYTTENGLRSERKWTTVPATISGKTISAPKPPPGANTWFISVVDDRDAMVSTEVEFLP
jgi:dienelactone hydrolase